MCLVISVLGIVFAYIFYNAGNILLAGGSVLVSAFFIFLMIRNILHVKKIREEKNDN